MNKYFLSLLLMLPLSFVIFAQDNESEDDIEEVVVTGIKSSLKDAIEIKRNNVGVVDALTAEDLGKFPDGNLAEALSRLVGVTTERSNDEGTNFQKDISHDPALVKAYDYVLSKGYTWH